MISEERGQRRQDRPISTAGDDDGVVERNETRLAVTIAQCRLICLPSSQFNPEPQPDVLPDEKSPVFVNDADPTFIDRVSDAVEQSGSGIEALDGDLLQLKTFSFLHRQLW